MIALAPDLRYLVRGENAAFVKCGIDPQEEALKRGDVPRDDTWGREAREKWGILHTPEGNSMRTEAVSTIPGDYRMFYANVRDAILGKGPIDVTHEQMLVVMDALESARESSHGRRTVAFPRKKSPSPSGHNCSP
jgi:scyllo-inositol 2-dehydrogenase (NADP+)